MSKTYTIRFLSEIEEPFYEKVEVHDENTITVPDSWKPRFGGQLSGTENQSHLIFMAAESIAASITNVSSFWLSETDGPQGTLEYTGEYLEPKEAPKEELRILRRR